ncbi:polysaccharide deacetylase family protein [Chondromyces apiculatus]|uniref:Polysaccharide deacetylase n=1 Tax=Chondromyces apiculatus DSM 436 TaxID=1192034 RepID=A0A017SXW7_9BACT|nr:polysaccharide deacetylase family protein [Chondromyces apiculatus]EYF01582.1 Polysaccharide deacetylase [Chondromyces apiculatus DSM 436]
MPTASSKPTTRAPSRATSSPFWRFPFWRKAALTAALATSAAGLLGAASGCSTEDATAGERAPAQRSPTAGGAVAYASAAPEKITTPPPASGTGVRIKTCPARQGKVVALSFDDGPSPYTDSLLAILKEKKAPAAFFLKAKKLARDFPKYEDYRARVKRIAEAGHAVCSHTFSHSGLVGPHVTEATIRADITKAEDLIADITGRRPKCLRPPFGDTDDRSLAILKEYGYQVILWNLNTDDWRFASSDRKKDFDPPQILALVQKTLAKSQGPFIHIQHDSEESEASIKMVPQVIDYLRDQGYTTISLQECLGQPIDIPR